MQKIIAVALAEFLALCPGVTLSASTDSANEQRVVLRTGANSGIGRMTVERRARSAAQIIRGKASDERLYPNHHYPCSYSREDLEKMMDSEAALVRADKLCGMPGEI